VDDTSRVAKSELPTIRIVEQTGRGKGNALREGFFECTGDVVVALDADGSMDPSEMGSFVKLVAEGFDYVKGSRMLPGGSSADLTRLRSLGNWVFRSLTNILTGSRYSDLCYGYFAFRRGTIDALDLRSDGFEIETEINIRAHRAGLRIAEVPSSEAERTHGTSQLNAFRDGLRILFIIAKASFGRRGKIEPSAPAPLDEAMTPAAVSVPIDDESPHGQNGHRPDYR
jgi:glycosyltransferase involved in cell wall biosynthesis